jgi:hypothetical protein
MGGTTLTEKRDELCISQTLMPTKMPFHQLPTNIIKILHQKLLPVLWRETAATFFFL